MIFKISLLLQALKCNYVQCFQIFSSFFLLIAEHDLQGESRDRSEAFGTCAHSVLTSNSALQSPWTSWGSSEDALQTCSSLSLHCFPPTSSFLLLCLLNPSSSSWNAICWAIVPDHPNPQIRTGFTIKLTASCSFSLQYLTQLSLCLCLYCHLVNV